MSSHIFHATDNPKPSDRALCYYKFREFNEPLDEHVEVCDDCQKIADAILKTVKKPS